MTTETLQPQETSLNVFRRFIICYFSSDGTKHLDARQVLSKECYQYWLNTRVGATNDPERTFQRSLTAHLTGSDGRQPFHQQEEEAILKIIRVKRVWCV